jgi:hypothetical protein
MRNLILPVALVAFWGCGDFSQTIRPTALELTTTSTTVPTGQVIEFRYDAQGRSLAGLIIDFGDGSNPDSLYLQGAVTATGRRSHTFTQTGSFVVSGRLEEFFGGVAEQTIPMTVTTPPE